MKGGRRVGPALGQLPHGAELLVGNFEVGVQHSAEVIAQPAGGDDLGDITTGHDQPHLHKVAGPVASWGCILASPAS
ncbi:MAG: hypothetical protein QG608_2715 [Actinomycetota bacterium]|nr:hypothetical protein [Actinomycetota bacterium]